MRFNEPTKKENKLFNSFSKPVESEELTPTESIKPSNWKDKYPEKEQVKPYRLESSTDDSELNRMVQLKNVDNVNKSLGKSGQMVFDKTDSHALLFIDETTGWVEILTSDLEYDIVRTKQIKSDTTAPSDLTITTGAAKTLVLATAVYNDANVGGMALRAGATTPPITQWVDNAGNNTGIYGLGFAALDEANGSIEIPHDYKEGTNIVFHVHWGANADPAGTKYVKWQLTYYVDGEAGGETTPPATPIVVETAYDTQYQHKRSDFPAITGTDFKIGDQINFNLKRIAAAGAAYAGVAIAETIGFHYITDTLGSRLVATK